MTATAVKPSFITTINLRRLRLKSRSLFIPFQSHRKSTRPITMNEGDELVTAMLAIALVAVLLVAGGLYVENSPPQASTVPAVQMASAP